MSSLRHLEFLHVARNPSSLFSLETMAGMNFFCKKHFRNRLLNRSTIGRYSQTSTICHGWHVGIKRSTYDEEKAPASLMQTSLASLPSRISSMMVLHCQENILNPWASECICTSQGSNDVEISTLFI